MSIASISALFAAGVGISAFGNMIGFGGGVFLLPVLTSFFGVPVHEAVAISLLSIFPATFIATVRNLKRHRVDILAGAALEIPTAVGTVVGSILCFYLSSFYLRFAFSVMVFSMAMAMLVRKDNKIKGNFLDRLNSLPPIIRRSKGGVIYRVSITLSAIVGIGIGVIAGLLGIGGGFMKTPLMVLTFGMPSDIAVSTSLFMITFTSAIGVIAHFYFGGTAGILAIVMPLSFMVGSLINIRFFKIQREKLKYMIAIGLVLSGLIIILY